MPPGSSSSGFSPRLKCSQFWELFTQGKSVILINTFVTVGHSSVHREALNKAQHFTVPRKKGAAEMHKVPTSPGTRGIQPTRVLAQGDGSGHGGRSGRLGFPGGRPCFPPSPGLACVGAVRGGSGLPAESGGQVGSWAFCGPWKVL